MGVGRMIEIKLTPEIRNEARREALNVGPLQGSITGGVSNVIGFIGEIIVAELMNATRQNTAHYDMVAENRRIDVKSKRCNTTPRPDYDCSVAAHGTKQQCDDYVFVRVLNDLSKAWVLGSIAKEEFYAKAKQWKKGEVDEGNGFVIKADCYNLPIKELQEVCQNESP
jgi:hypothetical protein